MSKNKVTKIMLWPSRTLDMGASGYAKLSAGVEIELDKSAEVGSPGVQKAFEEGREIVQDELKKQYAPYKELINKGVKKNG